MPENVLALLPKKTSLTSMAQCEHKLLFGDDYNPRDHASQIPPEYLPRVLHDTGVSDPNSIIVLGDPDLIKELGKSELWFADGTFAVVPHMYYQLYTLDCRVGTSYPPCLYALLSNEQEVTYNKFLNILTQHLLPTDVPHRILLNFEKAALNSFCQSFPQSQLQGR